MSRPALAALAIVALLGSTGCKPPAESLTGPRVHTESNKGLAVTLTLQKYSFYRGESIPVTVTAVNVSGDDIVIDAKSGALAHVILMRRTRLGVWDRIKRFPESDIMVGKRWRLGRGRSRSVRMNIEVAPDWPTGELLRLVAEVNGRPDVSPRANIDIFPTRDAYERGMGLKDD